MRRRLGRSVSSRPWGSSPRLDSDYGAELAFGLELLLDGIERLRANQ
jgi:hypothetical protein